MGAKRTRNEWTLAEVKILEKHYPTRMPIEKIEAMLPRHPRSSLMMYAQTRLKLKRPPHGNRRTPGWDRIKELLKDKQLTMTQIAEALGVSKPTVSECLRLHRSEWHIVDRIPRTGMHTWVIALGEGEDAPVVLSPKTLSQYSKERPNPFLVAAGAVSAPQTAAGRIFKQDMSVHPDELETA